LLAAFFGVEPTGAFPGAEGPDARAGVKENTISNSWVSMFGKKAHAKPFDRVFVNMFD